MSPCYRHRSMNNNELDEKTPTVSNLTADILRNTLTSCITIKDMLMYNTVYGTVFLINDGQVIDFI